MKWNLIALLLPGVLSAAANYTAGKVMEDGVEVVRLTDAAHGMQVSVVPSIGNRAYSFKVHGKDVLYFPLLNLTALRNAGSRALNGVPFLAPWANRIAGAGFWANGKRYAFNSDLGSVHVDHDGIAIHGMLSSSPLWQVTEVKADRRSAHVTSRLEFWKYPELMANWPFAHSYEMTYTLAQGVLQVTTTVTNLGVEPMPVVLGFHPYFQMPDTPRSQTSVHLPVRSHVETDATLVATGSLKPVRMPAQVSLADHTFDDGFTDLSRDTAGKAAFWVEAGSRKISVIYGPKYQVAVIYAPPHQNFVCFEPMAAITNGINLAHDGKYPALQSVAAGATWQESFWIQPTGF